MMSHECYICGKEQCSCIDRIPIWVKEMEFKLRVAKAIMECRNQVPVDVMIRILHEIIKEIK